MKKLTFIIYLIFTASSYSQEVVDPDPNDRLNDIRNLVQESIKINEEILSLVTLDNSTPTQQEPNNSWMRPLPKPIPDWAKVPELDNPLYVCNINGADTNPGTKEAPLASFERAVADNWINRNGSNRDILLCRGGRWEITNGTRIVSKNLDTDNYTYLGAYGEESLPKPHLKHIHGFFFENANRFYFHNIEIEGAGYSNKDNRGEGFLFWDKVNYIVLNNVKVHEYRLGINASEGRIEETQKTGELRNTHLAVINSDGLWNRVGFFFGGFSDQTFISNNRAWSNGGFGGAHNYYLSGEVKTKTRNYVFQLNHSHDSSPRNGKDGGQCSRGSVVVHGYIDNLYFVDNRIIEKKGNAEAGCWGAPVDAGRNSLWGIEEFPNLTYTGNYAEYTGNLLFGLTNADNALVGWNTGIIDASIQGTGFKAPNRTNEDVESKIKTLKVVYNNFHIEGTVLWNSTGIHLKDIGGDLDYNTITYDTPQKNVFCYWIEKDGEHTHVRGDTIEGSEYGTNKCFYSAEPTFGR